MLPARKRRPLKRPAASQGAPAATLKQSTVKQSTVKPSNPAPFDFRAALRDLVIAGLLLLSVALAFVNVARNEFVHYDDDSYIYDNDQIKDGITIQSVTWAFSTTYAANWHPLTWLSHMIDWQIYGAWPGGHHLSSVGLHAASTVILYFALAGMTRAPWPSAVVAALFAIHPLHVESVAWASERKDTLSTVFAMLTLWAYGRYVRAGSLRRYLSAITFFALGLLAKPMLVTLPLVLLLLDFWPLARWTVDSDRWSVDKKIELSAVLMLEKFPFFVLTVISCAATYYAQSKAGAVVSLTRISLAGRVLNACIAYVAYLQKTFFPRGLAPFYPLPEHVSLKTGVVAGVTILVVSLAVLGFSRNRRWLLVGWLWYLIMLVPVVGLVQVGQQSMADRYTYLPLGGIFIAVVWTVDQAARRWPRPAIVIFTSAILGLCIALTSQQSARWVTTLSLFSLAQEVTENNPVAHNNLGLALKDTDPKAARAHYNAAIALSYVEAHGNLGNLLADQGDPDGAIREYRNVLHFNPRDGKAFDRMAVVYQQQGKLAEVEWCLRQILLLDPVSFSAHSRLAQILQAEGKIDDALAEYAIAIKLRPKQSVQSLNNVAWIRATHPLPQYRDGPTAVELAERAKSFGPIDSNLLDTLAAAYAECGRFDDAQAALKQAINAGIKEKNKGLADIEQRADLYAKHQPFRDPVLLGQKK